MKLACLPALALALGLLGCVARAPAVLPSVPQPAVEARADSLAPPALSRLTLPLELELGWLLPMLSEAAQKELRLAQSDWTRVSADGANPEVDTHMQASVGELRAAVREGVVRLEVPVAYWGKVRARAKTPFGKVWLSKGTDWGTREAPGLITLAIDVRPSVDRAFKLGTRSTLADVKLEAPRGEKLCTTTFVRICISREEAAARVHGELEREIRARAPALLASVDARIAQQGDGLRAFISQALTAMARPSGAEQLALQVERLALGPFSGKQTRLRVDAELDFRTSASAAAKPAKLPARSELQGTPSELSYDVALTFKELGARWTGQLAAEPVQNWTLTCAVLGSEQGGPALVLALALTRGTQRLTVFAHAIPEAQGAQLRLTNLRFTPESRAALAALELDAQQLSEAIQKGATLSLADAAAAQLARIADKLGALTLALTPVTLRLERTHYEALRPAGQALLVRVRAAPSVKLAWDAPHGAGSLSALPSTAPASRSSR